MPFPIFWPHLVASSPHDKPCPGWTSPLGYGDLAWVLLGWVSPKIRSPPYPQELSPWTCSPVTEFQPLICCPFGDQGWFVPLTLPSLPLSGGVWGRFVPLTLPCVQTGEGWETTRAMLAKMSL